MSKIVTDKDYQVGDFSEGKISILMALFKRYAHIRESYDGERFVIHTGRTYRGYGRSLDEAITKAKHLLAKDNKWVYEESEVCQES